MKPSKAKLSTLMAAMAAGDPDPLVHAFTFGPVDHGSVLTALLDSRLDDPVADAFAAIWAGSLAAMDEDRMGLMRWYLSTEGRTALPARRRVVQGVLARLIGTVEAADSPAACDLMATVAGLAVRLGPSAAVRRAGSALLRRLVQVWLERPETPLRPSLLFAAIETLDLTLMRQMIASRPAGPLEGALYHGFEWATGLVIECGGLDPWISGIIARDFLADPKGPGAAHRHVQLKQHHGASFASLAPILHDMRQEAADPTLRPALEFGFWRARHESLDAEEAYFAARLREVAPDWSPDPKPQTKAKAEVPARATSPDLADLAEEAAALAVSDFRLGAPLSPKAVAAAFDRITGAMSAAPLPQGWTLQDVLHAAHHLIDLDQREFSWLFHYVEAPHAKGIPAYGTVDLRQMPVRHEGLRASAAALCRAALNLFIGGQAGADVLTIGRLVRMHTLWCLETDAVEAARRMLDRIDAMGLVPDLIALGRDDLRLALGGPDLPPPLARDDSIFHPFAPRKGWSRAEGVGWTALAVDHEVKLPFDLVWPDGRLEKVPHVVAGGTLSLAGPMALDLVAEDFVIGPKGTVLRPDPYHTSAEFPWTSAAMVASGRRAIRLRAQGETLCDTPVLMLEAFEALRWRNYYHWMVPILTRLAVALEAGLLDQRRLVVPEGLSRWMVETLTLLGLGPDRLLAVPLGHKMRFADAVLLSSVEHVSAKGLQALRRRLMSGPEPAPQEALFLSRRGQKLRKMGNEDLIEEIARDMGFRIISPQDFTVAEQIALFRQARGVAAVEGAALTNTLFAPPQTRVLAMLCQQDMMPIFNDLSLVLGQEHRKLAGLPLPVPAGGNLFQAPFTIDPDLARQSLTWVLKQDRP